MSRTSELKRRMTLLIAILLLPIQALAQQPGELIPTGDPLYDRLQQAVLDEHRAEIQGAVDYSLQHFGWAWAPKLATVQSWEAEFGERSDYWCLLAYTSAAQSGSRSLQTDLLEKAAACDDASHAVKQLLFERELKRIRDDAAFDAWQDEQLNRELIDSWLGRFPGEAWVCYEAADHLARYGMDLRWLELLELGNSLPSPEATELFPLSFVHRRMLSGGEVGNHAVAGSILAMRMTLPDAAISQLIGLKDSYKEMIVAGSPGGLERGLTALTLRELRSRSASAVPWLCCSVQLAGSMPQLVLRDLDHWQTQARPGGYSQYLADFHSFDNHCSGIQHRLEAADPALSAYLADNPQWGLLRDYEMYPAFPQQSQEAVSAAEAVGILLGQLNDRSMYHRYEHEYRLNRWLLDNEVPDCQRMLEHLATFDFEHPEQYVPMGTGD